MVYFLHYVILIPLFYISSWKVWLKSSKVVHILIALCLLMTLCPVGKGVNVLSIAAMLYMVCKNTCKGLNIHILMFCLWTMICSLVNGVWGGRDISWVILLMSVTPMIGMSKLKDTIVRIVFSLLPLLLVFNILTYIFGINLYRLVYPDNLEFCFSGVTAHPQWLGAITGLTCVYAYYCVLLKKNKDKLHNLWAVVMFLASIELGLMAGSRAALMAVAVTVGIMTILSIKHISSFWKTEGFIVVLIILMIPLFLQSTEFIEHKQNVQEQIGSSRANLWGEQWRLFKSHLLFGTGMIEGETGSSWLAVAAQTGLIGFGLLVNVLCQCFLNIERTIVNNDETLMFVSILMYIMIHGVFEGYILNPGYIMCWFFWVCIGYLINNKVRHNG